MRLHLQLSPNKTTVPFEYQQYLTGAFHKWIGLNTEHGGLSLYSFSWLKGGRINRNGLDFKDGASWHISAYNPEILKKIVEGIQRDPEVCCGMNVTELMIQKTPAFSNSERFLVDSPVLVKRRIEGEKKDKHYLYNDPQSDALLTETIKRKLSVAGLGDKQINISFDRNYPNAKTKLATYRNTSNRANLCPVVLEGDPEAIAFAWEVGVGNSTGIGFGSLR